MLWANCSKNRPEGFGWFRELISSVFNGVSGQETGTLLRFEPVEVVLFGCSTCLGLPVTT